jgi:hypothetical protein
MFELASGFIDVSRCDTAHSHGSGDDHISQLREQVIAATADPLARVYLLTELLGLSSQFRRRGSVRVATFPAHG